jgi:Skp family chaperone for outer membrane proteins
MTIKLIAARTVSAVAVLAFAGVAMAQAPARPAPPPVTHGAPTPGVCVYNMPAVITDSVVGKFVTGRLETIGKTVNAELGAEETAINNEAKAIDAAARAPGADEATLQKRAIDLKKRAKAFDEKANLRQREFNATQQKSRMRILQEVDPIVVQVYQQRQCSVLLSSEAVLLNNPAMDITPAIIAGLNGKIQQFAFDRERLDQPAAPALPVKPK